MATVPGSRSGAGGKIVANRRKQRLAATPYDRPPPPPVPQKSPNWFTGVVIPSARALASGAGKFLLSTIISESESSSSEDEDYGSEDDIDNVNEFESAYDGVEALNEGKATSSEMMQNGQEFLFSPRRTETKQIIEQLIMQETFSREERNRLEKVLNSRVTEGSVEAREERLLDNFPEKMIDHDVDIFNKAVLEAKRWFQDKKAGSTPVTKLNDRTSNLNSTGLEHVESGVGSPVDVARSYMRDRPPWASPTEVVELKTPLTTTMKLFNEGTSYSVSYDSLSSKKRNSRASGSWNIQEELRRVRSKATENMLRTPPAKIDPSLFAIGPSRRESDGASKAVSNMGKEMAELDSSKKIKPIDTLMDVGVSSGPALVALKSKRVGNANKDPSSNPAASVSENNEDSEAIHLDDECAPAKLQHPSSANHAGEHQSDQHSSKINGSPAAEVAASGGTQSENGFTPSQASLSTGVQNRKQYDEETQNEHTVSEKKSTNSMNVEGKCELLSEAYMEVPIVTEHPSGSQNGLSTQYEEVLVETTQPPTKEKAATVTAKQQGKKPSTRKSRGRGKGIP